MSLTLEFVTRVESKNNLSLSLFPLPLVFFLLVVIITSFYCLLSSYLITFELCTPLVLQLHNLPMASLWHYVLMIQGSLFPSSFSWMHLSTRSIVLNYHPKKVGFCMLSRGFDQLSEKGMNICKYETYFE